MPASPDTSDPAPNAQRDGISHMTFETKKKFAFVKLYITNGARHLGQVESQSTSKIVFRPPPDLIIGSELFLHVEYRHEAPLWKRATRKQHAIKLGIQEIIQACVSDEQGNQSWSQWYGRNSNCQLVIELDGDRVNNQPRRSNTSDLRPMTDQILEVCPHFRILVIGKTGSGKSSLINKTFGVEDAIISSNYRGEADINKEIRSRLNPQFILHDSLGFEPGEENNLEIVTDFIERRDQETELGEKLHTVWVCTEAPVLGGRLVESGIEKFFRLKTDGKLGRVPVILVFTKFDVLVDTIKEKKHEENPTSTTLDEDAREEAQIKLKELIQPMENITDTERVPHVAVSTWDELEYKQTLQKLIDVTFNTVFDYLADVSVVTAIAQKVNPDVKIRAIIEVGKRKYWSGLGSSLNFPFHTLERCLNVIHTDIVRVWDFPDKDGWLLCTEFRALMANGVDFKGEGKSNATLSVGLSAIGALAGIVSALSGPAAPIVVPIAGAFVFAAWAREVYVQSQKTLRRLMTYIVDLTLVTQNLFWIQNILNLNQEHVSRRMIKLAFNLHFNTGERNRLVAEIEEFSKTPAAIIRGGADKTFEKIEGLIKSSMIKYEDMFKEDPQFLRTRLEDQQDERW